MKKVKTSDHFRAASGRWSVERAVGSSSRRKNKGKSGEADSGRRVEGGRGRTGDDINKL